MVLPMWFLGINEAWSQEWDHEYVPFVEEGKVWNCKSTGFEIYKKHLICFFPNCAIIMLQFVAIELFVLT